MKIIYALLSTIFSVLLPAVLAFIGRHIKALPVIIILFVIAAFFDIVTCMVVVVLGLFVLAYLDPTTKAAADEVFKQHINKKE